MLMFGVRQTVVAAILSTAVCLTSFEGFAQSATTVTVSVINGTAHQTYQAPWTPNMSVLNAMEQALPKSPKTGAFSLNYFPEYDGYFVSAVAGVPKAGASGYWSTCLLPAGPGSTVITLPLAPNRILVGAGDTVSLIFNQSCPGAQAVH
jgi:hypothetical protein